MKSIKNISIIASILLFIALMVWFFGNIIAYVLIAAVLSLMGKPVVKFLRNFSVKNKHLPVSVCALLTLLLMIFLVSGLMMLFIPLLATQVSFLSSIDVSQFRESFRIPLEYLQTNLAHYGFINQGEDISDLVSAKVLSMFSITGFANIINNIISITGSLFVGIFAVSFITFFFLKDDHLFLNIVMNLTPVAYQMEVKHIILECQRLLTRYFLGLCIDITLVILLISLGMWIIGIKNALIIGFFAGVMNIVPYVGPFIGACLGLLLGVSGYLEMDFSTFILPLISKMLFVFVIVNIIDAILLQPTIYSNTVKAHPLEIFIIIMMAGTIAGVPGMMLAIPAYSVIRIIAREFFSRFSLVRKLTDKL